MVSKRGRGAVRVAPGDLEYWIASSDPELDQPLRHQALKDTGGDPWRALTKLCDPLWHERHRRTGTAPDERTTAAKLIGLLAGRRADAIALCRSCCSPAPANPPVPPNHRRRRRSGGGGNWIATSYGPPWGGIQGDGITATGLDLTAGQPAYEIAVDPTVIPLRSFEHVTPNPFGTNHAFYAG